MTDKSIDFDSQPIINLFEEYYDRLKSILVEKYEEESNQIQNILKILPEQNKEISDRYTTIETFNKPTFKVLVQNIFEFASVLQRFNLSITRIVKLFESPYLSAESIVSTDVSQTYRYETIELLEKIDRTYRGFKKKYDEKVHQINHNLIQMIHKNMLFDNKTDKEKVIIVQETFHEHRNAINLYVDYMQFYIDYLYDLGTKEAKQIMFYVLDLIEQDKDFFMTGHVDNYTTNTKIHLENPALKRFGLIPNTESLDLQQIFDMLVPQKSHKKETFESFAKNNKVGLIVMNKITPVPIEYNIVKLLNSPSESTEQGINENFINRMRVIRYLTKSGGNDIVNSEDSLDDIKQPELVVGLLAGVGDDPGGLDGGIDGGGVYEINNSKPCAGGNDRLKWKFSIDLFNKDNDNFYILDTLNGHKYRILTPYIKTTKYLIPKYRVKQLIHYATQPNKSDRITNYHTLACKYALTCMFAERAMPLDYLEENSKEVDTHMIRNELYLKLIKHTNALITKIKPKSQIDINDIIHDDGYQKIFMDTLYSLYNLGADKSLYISKFKSGELLSSFLVGLRDISRQFFKLLHDMYNREPLGNDVFKLPAEDRQTTVEKKLHDVVLKCLQLLISDKDNIYASINYKYLMLNFR